MKKSIFAFLALMLVCLASCEKNEIPVIDDINGPTLAQFEQETLVLPTPEEGASETVDILVTTISEQDRVIDLEIAPESTATQEQFTLSNLVIPANSYQGTFTITSNYEALPETGSSKLILEIEGIETAGELITVAPLEVEMFRTCPIVIEDFVGTWEGTTSWGYPSEVVTSLSEDGQLMINGLTFGWFQDWWGEVIVTNQPVMINIDQETGEITIPQQPYITSTWNGDPQPAYDIKGTGRVLNPCTKAIEINPVLVQAGTPIDGAAYGDAFREEIHLVP